MEKILSYFKQNKPTALIGILSVGILFFLILILSLISSGGNKKNLYPSSGTNPTPSLALTQSPFRILSTSPINGQQNVFPGEIFIDFTTDVPIISKNSFSLTLSPQLQYSYNLISSFPTTKVKTQVLGGLNKNTKYLVTVLNQNLVPVYSWSFTTSNQTPEDSSQLVKQKEQQILTQSYPLYQYVPYANNNFSVDYTDKLTLTVTITNSGVTAVKQEVLTWIKSHGVDPSTHTIIYKNNF